MTIMTESPAYLARCAARASTLDAAQAAFNRAERRLRTAADTLIALKAVERAAAIAQGGEMTQWEERVAKSLQGRYSPAVAQIAQVLPYLRGAAYWWALRRALSLGGRYPEAANPGLRFYAVMCAPTPGVVPGTQAPPTTPTSNPSSPSLVTWHYVASAGHPPPGTRVLAAIVEADDISLAFVSHAFHHAGGVYHLPTQTDPIGIYTEVYAWAFLPNPPPPTAGCHRDPAHN